MFLFFREDAEVDTVFFFWCSWSSGAHLKHDVENKYLNDTPLKEAILIWKALRDLGMQFLWVISILEECVASCVWSRNWVVDAANVTDKVTGNIKFPF